jgi:nondiscriminating glutamyl-tRNA synthetase
MSRVRTRFAPSPTGELHAGNVRIAVLNWAVARHHGGDFVVRIEDTDAERNVADAEPQLLEDLRWLGLDWDEGPDRGGRFGPYRQSERLEHYTEAAHGLMAAGHAYPCFCSPEALQTARAGALAAGENPRYPGTCRGLDPDDAARRARDGESYALRLRTPSSGVVAVDDVVRGRVTFDAADIGDFVIVRSDGLPTYNFAVVVDDAAMAISHVIRGAGHLSNTPHQLLVYRALDHDPPVFAHAPTVLGPDRKKLSKRSGARPLRQLREEGLHPAGVVNYLSLLGWSSPTEDEVLTPERIVTEVTLDRVNAADVVFDPTKMRWLSGRHIEAMSLGDLVEATRPYVETSPCAPLLAGDYRTAVEAVRSHLLAFSEVVDQLKPFLGPDLHAAPGAPTDAEAAVLKAVRTRLSTVGAWDPESIQGALREGGQDAGVRGRGLYAPLREALTGREHGPPLDAVITVQGRDRVLSLLAEALERARSGV